MRYKCEYNPKTDLKAVSPVGALDLQAAFVNNTIPAGLDSKVGSYNGIEDPASIAGRVHDRIDAEVCDKQIKNYKAPSKEGD